MFTPQTNLVRGLVRGASGIKVPQISTRKRTIYFLAGTLKSETLPNCNYIKLRLTLCGRCVGAVFIFTAVSTIIFTWGGKINTCLWRRKADLVRILTCVYSTRWRDFLEELYSCYLSPVQSILGLFISHFLTTLLLSINRYSSISPTGNSMNFLKYE